MHESTSTDSESDARAETDAPRRVAPSSTDWNGSTRARWNLTPATQTDAVRILLRERVECVPLYPLRYGLSMEGCDLSVVGPSSIGDYPEPPPGKAWGLRLLRPQSFVYLMYHSAGEFHAFAFQATSDGRFAPLPESGEERVADDADASPWLPAPTTEVTDTVYLMVTDTLLTEGMLESLSSRLEELNGRVVTRVKLAEPAEGQQDVARVRGTLDNHLAVPEMAGIDEKAALDMRWSESLHDVPEGHVAVTCLERFSLRFNQGKGRGVPLAPVLQDPVGVLSELNSLLGSVLAERADYASEASRKLRVRDMIIALGEHAYKQAERDARAWAPHTNAHASYRFHLEEGIQASAVAARAERLASYRQAEADAFFEAHPGRIEELERRITQAADALWVVWQGLEERYQRMVDLHDDSDTRNFLDLRMIVANTLLGLAYHQQGEACLESQLGPRGPLEGTILYRVLMGHSAFQHYLQEDRALTERRFSEEVFEPQDMSQLHSAEIDLTRGMESSVPLQLLNEVNTQALTNLRNLLEILPADGASAKLSTVVAALVDSGKLRSPEQFNFSRYRALVEAAEGSLMIEGKLPAGDIGSWVLKEHNGSAVKGFKALTLYQSRTEMAKAYAAYHLKLWDENGPEIQRLRFWHNVKLGLGVVGIISSAYTLKTTLDKLSGDDANTLVNSLNFGASALITSAAVATLHANSHEVARDRARIAVRSMMAGEVSDGLSNRWASRAIGLTAAAAIVQAVSDYKQSREETGAVHTIKLSGSILQLGAAGIGVLHLLGKTNIKMEVVKKVTEWGLQRTAINAGMVGAVETAASRAVGSTFAGASRVATLGAGPVGWILFGVQSFYLVLNNWHDRLVEEQRYTDWIACSTWGDGQRDTAMLGLLGGEKLIPYGDDEVQELRDYDRLWQKPRVSSDIDWLKALAENGPTHWEVEAGAPSRSIGFENRPTSLEVRTISVLLPGWKPQVSWYEIEHYHDLDWMGIEKTLSGRDRVEAYEGYGILTFDSANMIGNAKVKYYPNHAASPDFYLTNGNENGNNRTG